MSSCPFLSIAIAMDLVIDFDYKNHFTLPLIKSFCTSADCPYSFIIPTPVIKYTPTYITEEDTKEPVDLVSCKLVTLAIDLIMPTDIVLRGRCFSYCHIASGKVYRGGMIK